VRPSDGLRDELTAGGAEGRRRPRLLAVGPALDRSSYSRIVHGTLEHLRGWEIDHLGINYREPLVETPWRIHPNSATGDRFGIGATVALAKAAAPDAIFVFNSFLALPRYWELPKLLGDARPPLVAQCPLLGEAVDPRLVARLAFFDCLVVPSEGVKRHFSASLGACLDAGLIDRVPRLAVVPHGFDPALFHMLPESERGTERRRVKREVFGADLPEDNFVVLNANRNEPRKRIDATLRGFALFARDKPPGVRLHLHMGESVEGLTLSSLANDLGIAARVTIASPVPGVHPALSNVELNRLYNACDVGLNTASAEGWGMVSFEHAATGAAQIVPGHGVCGEIWEGCAEVLPATPMPPGSRYTKEFTVAAEAVAAALERLYGDKDYRADLARRSYVHATSPAYRWGTIGTDWDRLLRALDASMVEAGVA
jgi:glycosyltransferase involved in cell wall biosynthesis